MARSCSDLGIHKLPPYAMPHAQGLLYAVYIDGGSSGTRVHVFAYRLAPWPTYVQLNLPEHSFSVEPGLSAHAAHPERAAAALQPLLDFAYAKVRMRARPRGPCACMRLRAIRTQAPRACFTGATASPWPRPHVRRCRRRHGPTPPCSC